MKVEKAFQEVRVTMIGINKPDAWVAKTTDEFRGTFNRLIEIMGDIPVGTILYDQARFYAASLKEKFAFSYQSGGLFPELFCVTAIRYFSMLTPPFCFVCNQNIGVHFFQPTSVDAVSQDSVRDFAVVT